MKQIDDSIEIDLAKRSAAVAAPLLFSELYISG